MCEVCVIRAKCQKLAEEIDFRVDQYQKELYFERPEDAKDAKEYAMQALADLFNELDKQIPAMAAVEARVKNESFLDRLFKKESQVH